MSILAEFWEYILGGVLFLASIVGANIAGRRSQKAKQTENDLNAVQEVRDHEREAHQMDDVTLADRITRRD